MIQPDLWSWTPPVIEGERDGDTFDGGRDLSRLNAQMRAVYAVMRDGKWHTLAGISHIANAPEASVSARIRDLKKAKFGGFKIEKRYVACGLYHYRLVV